MSNAKKSEIHNIKENKQNKVYLQKPVLRWKGNALICI